MTYNFGALGATGSQMMNDPLVKRAFKLAREQGWTIERTGKEHWKFTPPDPTKRIVFHSGTGGGGRGNENFVARLIRNGLVWTEDMKAAKAQAQREQQETKAQAEVVEAAAGTPPPFFTPEEQREYDQMLADETRAAEQFARDFPALLAAENRELAAKAQETQTPMPSVVEIAAAAAEAVTTPSRRKARAPKGLSDAVYLAAGLGKVPDTVVAERLGVAPNAVWVRRKKLGIPAAREKIYETAQQVKREDRRKRRVVRRTMTPAEMVADMQRQFEALLAANPKRAEVIRQRLLALMVRVPKRR